MFESRGVAPGKLGVEHSRSLVQAVGGGQIVGYEEVTHSRLSGKRARPARANKDTRRV